MDFNGARGVVVRGGGGRFGIDGLGDGSEGSVVDGK